VTKPANVSVYGFDLAKVERDLELVGFDRGGVPLDG
jgi:hypothetical protein